VPNTIHFVIMRALVVSMVTFVRSGPAHNAPAVSSMQSAKAAEWIDAFALAACQGIEAQRAAAKIADEKRSAQ
jgi:hypothetical protein